MPDCLYTSFASSSREKNYLQINKEALTIVFGVRQFHQYLYARSFTTKPDYKPLQHLFGEGKGIPAMASACVQCWVLTLSAYDYEVQYVSGKEHANTNVFSHLHSWCDQER